MNKVTIFVFILSAPLLVAAKNKEEHQYKAKDTEQWEPEPAIVSPVPVPSDAIVLFDGTHFDAWVGKDGKAPKWKINNGAMTVVPNTKGIRTKENFCDIQLHIEWKTPPKIDGAEGQKLGNSGIFIQQRYELQVLDSFNNRTYANGQAGAIYKQSPPLVNPSLAPGQWQSYDIIYSAPTFKPNGSINKKATITVLHNGVLIQNHFELQGSTTFIGPASYRKAHGCAPLGLQDHRDAVSYRNIWVRRL